MAWASWPCSSGMSAMRKQASLNDPQELSERYRIRRAGRRVLTHTLHRYCTLNGCESACSATCGTAISCCTRSAPVRAMPCRTSRSRATRMVATGVRRPVNAYGGVAYTHAAGIDRPIGAMRLGAAPWGSRSTRRRTGGGSTSWRRSTTGRSLPMGWRGRGRSGAHSSVRRHGQRRTKWFGGLVTEQADASGLLYRRNRYYDPRTGRFTQPDPIGWRVGECVRVCQRRSGIVFESIWSFPWDDALLAARLYVAAASLPRLTQTCCEHSISSRGEGRDHEGGRSFQGTW